MKQLNDILEGSRRLLSESVDILESSRNDIVVVGGWGPYLRHPEHHPGTKDVDILFPTHYSKERISTILERFLENDFFVSAKHDFQLCRAYKIGKRTYIYNVDLLHPTEGKVNKVDFVEIMDLDVTSNEIKVKTITSVNIQYGDVIYTENLFENLSFDGRSINVLDGAGIIISKINSCHNKKRERDIYDIYLSLKEQGTLGKINHLLKINPTLETNFKDYANRIQKDWRVYDASLRMFGVSDPGAQEVLLMGRS